MYGAAQLRHIMTTQKNVMQIGHAALTSATLSQHLFSGPLCVAISYCAGILFLSKQDHSLHRSMISIEEIPVERINEFWKIHIKYLVDDGIIADEEDIAYFAGKEYRGILEGHMIRSTDKQHMIYFCRDGERIGAASYCSAGQ